MLEIYDEIHGFIDLSEAESTVLGDCVVQRLRRIRQLGPADLVYPGAVHTRFSHSLGTLYLAERIAKSAGVEDEGEVESLRLAALLHDVGHMPFSHALSSNHEKVSQEVVRSMLGDLLGKDLKHGVIDILAGSSRLSPILASEVDADRLDYLLRDSKHTGVSYGNVDVDRAVRSARLVRTEAGWTLGFVHGAETAVENILLARTQLFRVVYYHRTVGAFEAVLRAAYAMLVEEGYLPSLDEALEEKELWCMFDDCMVIEALKRARKSEEGRLKELATSFLLRKPPKLVFEAYLSDGPGEGFRRELYEHALKGTAEELLVEKCGVPEGCLLVYLARIVPIGNVNRLLILHGESAKPLVSLSSTLLSYLKGVSLSPLRVYAFPECLRQATECLSHLAVL